jgi:hypothetical protein
MSWYDFINSEYNTGNWYIENDKVRLSSLIYITGITPNEAIVDNRTYGTDTDFVFDKPGGGLILF